MEIDFLLGKKKLSSFMVYISWETRIFAYGRQSIHSFSELTVYRNVRKNISTTEILFTLARSVELSLYQQAGNLLLLNIM